MDQTPIACPECDLLHHPVDPGPGGTARCTRCGAVLDHRHRRQPGQLLALVVAALITFAIANAFPIVDLEVQGITNSTTLFGAVLQLWEEGRGWVAGLVFFTAIIAPLVDLLAMAALLAAVARHRRPAYFAPLLRGLQSVRPWGMVEVMMLGVLVSLIKLSHMARILPGPALWAFGALTILLTLVITYDLRHLWDAGEEG